MSEENDQRNFHRIFYKADAILSNDSNQWPCKLIDISLHGCLLHLESNWQEENLEKLFTLTLKLSETTSIIMNLLVSHIAGDEVGFKCEHIDLDSISTLRRLVELNLGDSDILERDLIALTHPR